MALQASGPIKWSEITNEFGDPAASTTTTFYNVPWVKWTAQTAWVQSSLGGGSANNPSIWSSFMRSYAVYPSNTDPLIGTHTAIWRIAGGNMSISTLPADTYTLRCQSDNGATFTWDDTYLGATSSFGSEDTFTTFTINNTEVTEHYLTVSVTNIDNGGGWSTNPGGVAWELKNSSGTVIRRSLDSFNYDYPSTGWGTLLRNYAVYPSNTSGLTDTWHETTYLFTPSAGTHTLEAVADAQSQFYLDDGSGETSVLTTSGNEVCSIGSCNSANLGTLSNQTYKLRVRVYNGSQTPNIYGTNSWFNPGGVAFIIKNSSGSIIKSSNDTGSQGSITTSSGSTKFGNYRMNNSSEFGGMVVPLDTDCGPSSNVDIPTGTSPISFSNFYNARLNIAVDYYTSNENRPENALTRLGDPNKRRVVGGFKGVPANTSGSKVAIVVNKIISGKSAGANGASVNECSLRTGNGYDVATKVSIQVGSSGRIYGAGGDGGTGGDVDGYNRNPSDGSTGENGTSALGIEHNLTAVKVRSGGKIVSGFGGGGGGGGAFEDSRPGEEWRPRCASGGGGGGGAGSPAGAGGATGSITTHDPNEHASPGDAGSAGSEPNGSEQGGAGGSGNCNPPTGSCEAKGGTGGRGRDEETTGSGFDNDGTGQVSQGRTDSSSYVGSNGGAAGSDGAAIRRRSGYTITVTNDGTIDGETTATGVS